MTAGKWFAAGMAAWLAWTAGGVAVETVSVEDDPVKGIMETPEVTVHYDPATGKRVVEKPLAKIGIVTDTHLVTGNESTFRHLEQFYALFRREGVEMIVNCGDIAWNFDPPAYERAVRIRRAAYPDPAKAPREVFIWAGHDANRFPKAGYRGHATAQKAVWEMLGVGNSPEDSFTFKGFEVLVMPQEPFDPQRYEQAIAAACAKNPSKPVFLFEHEPGACTTQNSPMWGNVRRREILSRHPQVIAINGHSHGTLRDERNIWQGAYTSVSAACLSHWQSDVVGVPVKTMWNHNCLLAELYADRIVFHRRDLNDGSEIGEPWTVTWPFDPKTAPYAPERRFAGGVPQFPSGASVSVKPPDAKGLLQVEFPAATDVPSTHAYRLVYSAEDGRPVAVREVFGEFHLPQTNWSARLSDVLAQEYFAPGAKIGVTVSPCGFGGQQGRPLKTAFTVPQYARKVLWTGLPEGLTEGVGRIPHEYAIPAAAVAALKPGTTVRVVADLAVEQTGSRPANFMFRSRAPNFYMPWINTLPGNSDLRYVFDLRIPESGCPNLELRFRPTSDPGKVRIRNLTFL